jgi:hypothetical protein
VSIAFALGRLDLLKLSDCIFALGNICEAFLVGSLLLLIDLVVIRDYVFDLGVIRTGLIRKNCVKGTIDLGLCPAGYRVDASAFVTEVPEQGPDHLVRLFFRPFLALWPEHGAGHHAGRRTRQHLLAGEDTLLDTLDKGDAEFLGGSPRGRLRILLFLSRLECPIYNGCGSSADLTAIKPDPLSDAGRELLADRHTLALCAGDR